MADLTRVHGSPSGNVSYDRSVANVGDISADELVDVAGRKLAFFKIVVQNGSNTNQDMRTEMGPNECVEKILQIVQIENIGKPRKSLYLAFENLKNCKKM